SDPTHQLQSASVYSETTRANFKNTGEKAEVSRNGRSNGRLRRKRRRLAEDHCLLLCSYTSRMAHCMCCPLQIGKKQLVPPAGSESITPGTVEQKPRLPERPTVCGTAVTRKVVTGSPALVWSTAKR